MSDRGPPESFTFTPDNLARAQQLIARYPEGRQASAVLALLDLAQRQHDSVSLLAGHWVLGVPLFYLGEFAPAREHLVQGMALCDLPQHHASAVGSTMLSVSGLRSKPFSLRSIYVMIGG